MRTFFTWKKNDVEGEKIEEKSKENQGQKRPRKTAGSHTDEDNPNCSCHNMANTIEVINQKLDLAQSKFQEIDNLKENLKDLQKETINLKESISFAHKEIAKLKEISQFQEGVIKALQIGVNGLRKDVKMERQHAIRLESHSQRNECRLCCPKLRRPNLSYIAPA